MLCPECGRDAGSASRLLRTRRRPARALAGLALLAPAYAAYVAPWAMTRGWWNSVPTPVLIVVLQFYDSAGETVFQNVESRLGAPGAAVSDWERLLVARHCGKMLRDSAPPGPAAGPVPDRPPVNLSAEEQAELGAMAAASSAPLMPLGGSSPRRRALAMLDRLGPHVRPAVPALVRLLEDPDHASVMHAARILGKSGESRAAIDALSRMLSSENYHFRAGAAQAIGDIGPPAASAIPALDAAVSRAKESIGGIGVSALVRIGPRSVPALTGLLEDPRPSVRYIAADALKKLGRDAGTPEVLRALARVRESDEIATVRLCAAIAAGTIGGARATELLTDALSDPYAMVRYWAAKHLRSIGPGAASALPALRRTLEASEEEYLREAIEAAIGAIEGS